MENVATSVRIPGDAISVLTELSEKLGKSKAQVIELALRQLEERMFWDEVRDSFEKIAADPEKLAAYRAEAELWEAGTGRDLVGEEW